MTYQGWQPSDAKTAAWRVSATLMRITADYSDWLTENEQAVSAQSLDRFLRSSTHQLPEELSGIALWQLAIWIGDLIEASYNRVTRAPQLRNAPSR